jgi:hypothetical protein
MLPPYWKTVLIITSILAINPVLPQAQYLELMFQQVFSVCLASALTLLQLFCVIKAREHTSPPLPAIPVAASGTPPPVPYNSSASVVSAIWLVVLVFGVCYVRSARPQLLPPCINFTVVVVVTSSVAPVFPTMAVALGFARQLLVVNLSGLAASIAVVMILFHTTNRTAFKKDVAEWQRCIEKCLAAKVVAMGGLLFNAETKSESEPFKITKTPGREQGFTEIATSTQALLAVVDKMQIDLRYARREISIGKLTAKDMSQIEALLYEVLLPVVGLMSGTEYVRKLSASADFHAHQQQLLAGHENATQTHEVLVQTLRSALEMLGLMPKEHSSFRGSDVETAQGNDSKTLSDLKSRVQHLKERDGAQIEAWQNNHSQPHGQSYSDTEQSVLFAAIEVCTKMHLMFRFQPADPPPGTGITECCVYSSDPTCGIR